MMESLLLDYARDLNDAYPGHEFSIWSREQLLRYFNDAVCLIAAHRPDLFTELKVVQVNPCSTYLDVCDCVRILEVLGQCDKHGNIIRPLSRKVKTTTAWGGPSFSKKAPTNILTEYELTKNSNLVRVFPDNLDPDKPIYVLVRCAVDSKYYTMDSEPPSFRCAFLAAASNYVLFCAKMMDAEVSPNMMAAAKQHQEMFLSILSLVKTADDELNKDISKK